MGQIEVLTGIPASPGIAVGPAHIYYTEDFYVVPRRLAENEVDAEIARFDAAVAETHTDLEDLSKRAVEEIGEAAVGDIFRSHLQILDDATVFGRIAERVRDEKRNVEYILAEELAKLRERFRQIEDEYLADRFLDIADVCKRVQRKLVRREQEITQEFPEPVVIVAHDLTPSETMQLDRKNILGFVTIAGGPTCHTAILAKALEIPAVVGAKAQLYRIRTGDTLIVDGFRGEVTVNPDAGTVERVEERQAGVIAFEQELGKLEDLPAETTDGTVVSLYANLDIPEEIASMEMHGAVGVGLYRTEYLFLNRLTLPTEEEQFTAYRRVVEHFADNPVTLRTLDVGGDRILATGQQYREINPVMGARAIRFSLANPDIFRTQLRAICRASAYGNLRVMFPMVSGLGELRRARQIFDTVYADLRMAGTSVAEHIPVGVMVELPSAVFVADLLARECDFLSVGSNDLIQYTLGVDRINELVAHLYEPAHPGIVRSLHHLFRAAEAGQTPVSVCGDIAGHPGFTLLLLGLGLREFSMVPAEIPEIKRIIRAVSLSDAQAVAAEALGASTASEIRGIISRRMRDLLPKVDFEWEYWFTAD